MIEKFIHPFLGIELEVTEDDRYIDTVQANVAKVERNVLLAMKLRQEGKESFYTLARKIKEQVTQLRDDAKKIKDDHYRNETARSLRRIAATMSLLHDYGPYVGGSGGQVSARPTHEVKSVSSGGLPGHGKRA